MTVNFYLERRKARVSDELHIIMYIRFDKKLLKVGTKERIDPDLWDVKKGRVKPTASEAEDLNDMLDAWEAEVKSVNRRAKASLSTSMTVEYLKKNLSFIRQHDGTFFGVWEKCKQDKQQNFVSGTINSYNTVWKTLKVIDGSHPGLKDPDYKRYRSMDREREFIKKYGRYEIDFGSINNDFVRRLKEYTIFMRFRNKFCNQILTKLKAFMNWAVENEYIKDTSFRDLKTRLKVPSDEDNIYFLTSKELADLTYMKIDNERLAKVRDIFCFSCYTGFRYGDVMNFKKDDVIDNKYRITQQKTSESLSNPLFEPAKDILKKYEDLPGPYALPKYSDQKINDYLKELARLAGLDRKITLIDFIGPETIHETVKLHELLHFHVGRKTFTTYLINNGMSETMVKAFTGHKTDVIKRYYKILDEVREEETAKINKQYRKDRKLRKI